MDLTFVNTFLIHGLPSSHSLQGKIYVSLMVYIEKFSKDGVATYHQSERPPHPGLLNVYPYIQATLGIERGQQAAGFPRPL